VTGEAAARFFASNLLLCADRTANSALEASMSSKPAAVPEGSFVVLWAGEDPVLHESLLEDLDAAEIPYADKPFGQDEVAPTADPLPIDWKPRFGFEVAVRSTDLAEAREILEALLELEPVDSELPEPDGAMSPLEALPAKHDEIPSLRLWSGDDHRLLQFLTDALRENGVPMRTEKSGAQTAILVPPSCEVRASEILREVREGAPPV
jgi:hypothetical protein